MTARKATPAAAGPFRDLAEFLDDAKPISLPWRGKVYEFPGSVSGRTGLLLSTALDGAVAGTRGADGKPADPELVELLNDEQEASVHDEVFGGVDRDLIRDGADSRVVRHFFLTLITWHVAGPDAAVNAWESLGNDPAPAPNRADRRRSRTASSAGASRTPRAASGSGTRAARPAAARRGGSGTSSRAGR